MKTSGLRNKKPARARAAWRSELVSLAWFFSQKTADSIDRWHRSVKGAR